MNKEKIINWSLAIIIISLISFTIISYANHGTVYSLFKGDTETLSQELSDSALAVILFILLVALECVIAPIPALILYVAGGMLFGPLLGGLYSIIGNLIGAALAFALARKWARGYFEKKIPEKTKKKFHDFSIKHGALAIFLLRVNPLTSSDLFSYVGGLSRMKFWKFLLGTGLGLAPLVYAQTYAGEALSHNPFLVNIFILISSIYVIGFILIAFYIQWRKSSEGKRAIRQKNRRKKRERRRKKRNAKLSHKKR